MQQDLIMGLQSSNLLMRFPSLSPRSRNLLIFSTDQTRYGELGEPVAKSSCLPCLRNWSMPLPQILKGPGCLPKFSELGLEFERDELGVQRLKIRSHNYIAAHTDMLVLLTLVVGGLIWAYRAIKAPPPPPGRNMTFKENLIHSQLAGVALVVPVVNYRWPCLPREPCSSVFSKLDLAERLRLHILHRAPKLAWMLRSWLPWPTVHSMLKKNPRAFNESDMRIMNFLWSLRALDKDKIQQQGDYVSPHKDMEISLIFEEFLEITN
ncbi:hypothetical protein AKJ16_DCAP18937 [Drosera capensis]